MKRATAASKGEHPESEATSTNQATAAARRRKRSPATAASGASYYHHQPFFWLIVCLLSLGVWVVLSSGGAASAGGVERSVQDAAAAADGEQQNSHRGGAATTEKQQKLRQTIDALMNGKKPKNDLHKEEQQLRVPPNQKDEEELVSQRFVMELSGLTGGDSSSVGRVVIETRPAWAPIGAAHFLELVQHGYYDQCRFFRVLPNFVAQFGIAADPQSPLKTKFKQALQDDPVVQSNTYGTLTYATSGKNTRRMQLFVNVNKKGNAYLDKEGFAPFAEVIEGMEYIEQINKEYRQKPSQGKIQNRGNEYLNQEFPDMSYIVTLRQDTQQHSTTGEDA